MKIRDRLFSINAVLKALVFKKKTPLMVNWAITNRCNKSCLYCDTRNIVVKELETGQALAIITELSEAGTKHIQFTGGEPLLREDMGMLLDYCSERGILTSINSNGSIVGQRIKDLSNLNLLGLSLDGPEQVHDYIRGKGSYGEVIAAIALAKERGISTRIHTVLSRLNLQSIDFLLAKAEAFRTPIFFQPSAALLLEGNQKNRLSPDEKEYKQAIGYLIAKKRKARYIGNSISGLKFLHNWPYLKKITCLASLICCRIESDGSVDICTRNQFKAPRKNTDDTGIRRRFYRLPFLHCNRCCCALSVDLNCSLHLNPDAIYNAWNISRALAGGAPRKRLFRRNPEKGNFNGTKAVLRPPKAD
jgi:MoaA/NifB/PqqE/SkfB family radical SAM enzyme